MGFECLMDYFRFNRKTNLGSSIFIFIFKMHLVYYDFNAYKLLWLMQTRRFGQHMFSSVKRIFCLAHCVMLYRR